jgi:carboxymethylenebutenolidase
MVTPQCAAGKAKETTMKHRGTDVRRRGFVAGLLAAGFARAVQPVNAQTLITTDARGLTAGAVTIPAASGELPAYRAMPRPGKSFPVVLVVHEIFGVHEHIRDVCRRLAKLGYLALAPELFARQGDVAALADIDAIRAVVARVPDAQVLGDLDAAATWAAAHGGDGRRLGITGFCWGGRIVWLYAAHNARLQAGVAWYGRLFGGADALHPRQPLDVAASLKAPVLGLYGGADQGIPVETVELMRDELKAAGGASEIVLYPDAPHAFFADYRPSYRRQPAEDGWRRLQQWFARHGV